MVTKPMPEPQLPVTARMGVEDVVELLEEENKALQEALTLSRKRLQGMRDVAKAMAGRLDLDQLLRVIIAKVSELCDADRATLFVVDEPRQELWSRVMEGGTELIRLPLGSGVAGAVARSGVALNLADARADTRFNAAFDERSGYRTRSLVAYPIVSTEGKVIGVVEALNKRSGPFSVEDERMLEAICAEVSVALKNALLFEELRVAHNHLGRRVQELDLLVDIERALLAAESTEALTSVVVKRARDLLGADAGLFALIDPNTGQLEVRAHDKDGTDALLPRLVPVTTGIMGAAIRTEQAVRVADAVEDPRFATQIALELDIKPGPYLAVPLLANGRAYGALAAARDRGQEPFTDDDVRILSLLGGRVATALASTRAREKSKNEAQLEALGTMLAGIVHDLKTPMTVISGYVQLMALEDDAQERQANAETVLKNCDQMTSMIKELLQFVRGESSILIRKVYLQQFMADVEDMLKHLAGNRDGITVTTSVGYRGAVRMDDLKMKRAIANLGKNAIEALAGHGGTVSVSAEQIGDQVEIAVKDSGPGLPPEIEGRLFEQFATHGKKDGTGLGLSLVKKIVEDHGGEIRVESRRGEGVTFRLRLPL
jgi:signal transduction histidine kinase